MIDRQHELPLACQARLVGLSRGAVYYEPRPIPEEDLMLMRRIDELHLELPFAGSRMLRDLLGGVVNDGIELAGMRFTAAPEWLTITPQGITLSAFAGAAPVAGVHPCVGAAPPPRIPSGTAALAPPRGMLSVAASRAYVQQLLEAAWQTGWLCFDTREHAIDELLLRIDRHRIPSP